MKLNLSPRTLAIAGAVLSGGVVAGAGALVHALEAGQIHIDPALAAILAATLTGALSAFVQSNKASTPTA